MCEDNYIKIFLHKKETTAHKLNLYERDLTGFFFTWNLYEKDFFLIFVYPCFMFLFISIYFKWQGGGGGTVENGASPARGHVGSAQRAAITANVPLFRRAAVDRTVVSDVPRARRINNSTFKRP